MKPKISRRFLVKRGVTAISIMPFLGLISLAARSAGLTPLDPNDPTAKALGFVTDSTKVDAATNPTHLAGQKCGTCAQFQATAGEASGGCNIFAGHAVPQGGWCRVWAQKPGA
ncbi:MAG: high-potential iron-sulfur protein [Pseudomonadota bacterium]|nr:high-potential iron-sulfur protein [Pseudomonadota bacterium]